MENFTTFDIVKKLGINRSSLKQWLERGFIVPSVQEARGKGTKNIFSIYDIDKIVLFEHLCYCGLSQREVSGIINDPGVSIHADYLIISREFIGNRIRTTRKMIFSKTLPDIEDKTVTIVINLKKIRQEVIELLK